MDQPNYTSSSNQHPAARLQSGAALRDEQGSLGLTLQERFLKLSFSSGCPWIFVVVQPQKFFLRSRKLVVFAEFL